MKTAHVRNGGGLDESAHPATAWGVGNFGLCSHGNRDGFVSSRRLSPHLRDVTELGLASRRHAKSGFLGPTNTCSPNGSTPKGKRPVRPTLAANAPRGQALTVSDDPHRSIRRTVNLEQLVARWILKSQTRPAPYSLDYPYGLLAPVCVLSGEQ